MKKRLFPKIAACALAVSLCLTQASAVYYAPHTIDANRPFGLFVFSESVKSNALVEYPFGFDLSEVTHRAGELVSRGSRYSSFSAAYAAFSDPENDSVLKTVTTHTSVDDKEGTPVFNKNSHLAMMIDAMPSGDVTLDQPLVVSGRKAQLGIDDVNEKITLNLQGGIQVTDGGTLVIMNDSGKQYLQNMNLAIELGDSIVVEDGAHLVMQSVDNISDGAVDIGDIQNSPNTVIAPSGKPAIVVNGGTVDVSYQTIEREAGDDSTQPLIQVQSGEVNFQPSTMATNQTGIPEFTDDRYFTEKVVFDLDNGASGTPAVSVADGAAVTVNAGDFTASGTGPIFDLASGGKLTLEGGTITNSDGQPAITVDKDATLVIPSDSDAKVTSTGGTTAIDLADGSKIEKDGNTITVGTNPTDDGANDNYVDNDGNIILGSGGSVVRPDGTTTDLPNGGTVTPEGEVKPTPGPTPPPQPQPDPQPQPQPEDPAPAEPDNDHTVSLPAKTPGGTVKVSPRYAEKGETVTVTVTPDPGYELDHLTVSQRDGRELDLTDKGNGKFTFTMPDAHVRLSAAFRLVRQGSPFVDVAESAYYADAVKWAVENGVTGGTTADTFSPNASCTRAQMVTFLWRASGSPAADRAVTFTDVAADAYYAPAVQWAVAQGITSGTTADTFSPNAPVTRAQTVTFLYRLAGSPETGGAGFDDVAESAYYAPAVRWAVAQGVTSGTTANTFSPSAPCTRAQIVTFLYRDLAA